MRINKKLNKAAAFNPTKKSHQLSIADMCKKIYDNKMTLPLYQRDLSWNLNKVVNLFNYQLFGKAPVAPISINQISTKNQLVPQISFIDRELIPEDLIDASHQSVVDGQQRLSTNYKAYINHPDFKNIYLDVSAAKFKIVTTNYKDTQIPVGILFNKEQNELLEYLKAKNLVSELYPLMIDVRSKIMGYNYTINIADDLTEEEQIEWFEVLNNAGSRVSTLQMRFSKLKLHNFDIYSDYISPFKNLIADYDYNELFAPFTTNVSYPVASLNPAYEKVMKREHKNNFAPIPSDTKENQITNLSPEDLNEVTEVALSGIKKALEFLSKQGLEKYVTRMDHILYVSGYYIFNENPSDLDLKNLREWITKINFTNQSNGNRREIFDKLILNDFS